MGEWKKLITASDNIGALDNVSNATPSDNDTLKWDGNNWVPAVYTDNVLVYNTYITFGESITSYVPSNNYGSIQVSESNNVFLEDGDTLTVFKYMASGDIFTDFYYRVLIASGSAVDVDDYSGDTIKTRYKDDSLVDLGGVFAEGQSANGGFQLVYTEEDADIPYPTSPASAVFTEDESTLEIEFKGQVGSIDPYTHTTHVKMANPPFWDLSAETQLTSINDADTYGWNQGPLSDSNGIWQTEPNILGSSHYHSGSDGWKTFTLTGTSQYIWFTMPTRMNAAGLTAGESGNYDANATYKPTVLYRKNTNDVGSNMPGTFMGKRTSVQNSAANFFEEDFYYWTAGTWDTGYNGSVEIKIIWEAA